MKITVDGNTACATIAYKLSEIAGVYPITPSSTMAEVASAWAEENNPNLFGLPMTIKQMQSEAGAAGVVHGSLTCGALATTFTASQGLLLMIPNMYKIAGELLPCVFHVSARAIATHALSIFGDHSDVMAVRQTGFCMLASSSVQECYDMALASHIATLNSSVPFLHFFDGFRTSHEIQKIEILDDEKIKEIYPYQSLAKFKARALDPLSPRQQGTAQNPDIFFQNKEACNQKYANVYTHVVNAFAEIEKVSGRRYAPFEYHGHPNAKYVIVIMGSGAQTAIETANFLAKNGERVGVVNVRLYRPFNTSAFAQCLPKTVEKIAVLDRTKESAAPCEPLCQDVAYALAKTKIKIVGGRYGLGSKEFYPKHVVAVFSNLKQKLSKNNFTVGINDDVTYLSLPDEDFNLETNNKEFKFFGLGSDGTISANKNAIKIIGETTNSFVQGYFEYDSKKSGSLTTSHLRISENQINAPYIIEKADLVAIHNYSFVNRYHLTKNLKQNSVVLLNTTLSKDEICKNLPEQFVLDIQNANAKLYIINASKIAQDVGLGNKINIIMQTAFFKLANIIEYKSAKHKMQQAIKNTYGKKGDDVVEKNLKAIDLAESGTVEVNLVNLQNQTIPAPQKETSEYYKNFISPIESLNGNSLPVSAFNKRGYVPTDTSKYLKRGIAERLPCWKSENCIQCGMCVTACPHSVIHAKIIDEKNLNNATTDFITPTAFGIPDKKYKLQISPLDCTGCGVCAKVCPAKNKALEMVPAKQILEKEKNNYNFYNTLPCIESPFSDSIPKGLQFKKSYFEFSGACAGCGETPYIKLASQLFGQDMIIANATGCSSIYGGNAPVCPYAKDKFGYGPAWANSLFEDNAEFGFGISLAVQNNKQILKNYVLEYQKSSKNKKIKEFLQKWLENNLILSKEDHAELVKLLNNAPASSLLTNIKNHQNYFTKKSIWIIGGDGWAYDIGFGGLDHLFTSNENVNVLVLDSEVYSNTGGQASKSTPKSAIAKLASTGKISKKKDLGQIAMLYKNAYVASISLGANMAQAIKAFKEAEEFNGVSIIIAYAPCVNHGIDMSNSNNLMKEAVDCGYWNLYRYNPNKETPLELDSPEPQANFKNFLLGQARFKALIKANPENAEALFEACENDAKERRKYLCKMINNE